MTTGAQDKKKVAALAILGAVALYLFYANVLAGPDIPREPAASGKAGASQTPGPEAALMQQSQTPRAPARIRSEEFHPVLRSRRQEDQLDPRSVDPTLRLDLFAKVQKVELAGGSRNLFQFSVAPPPKPVELPKGKEPKVIPQSLVSVAQPSGPAPPPPPPPISLKFYGFSTVRNSGRKTAYFLDGDEILSGVEGDVLKRRYKVVKIGPNSVLMEDTNAKHQQSLPLVAESQS